jgi:hypothetical protein
METAVIPWKRFWCPLGTAISCGPDGKGFLDNPEDLLGGYSNASLRDITQLLENRFLALCGEPGIGKSSTITQAKDEIRRRAGSDDNLIWIEFRSVPDTATFLRRTLESSKWKRWEQSSGELTLVVDGVDEGLVKIPAFIQFFAEELKTVDRGRLRVILLCRTAEWPVEGGNHLISLWGNADNPCVYELCPLRQVDVHGAAAIWKIPPEQFLEAVHSAHVVGLAARPITLFFLMSEFRREGRFPGTHRELYERGCANLSNEPDVQRIEILRSRFGNDPAPSSKQVLRIACRIAGLLMLSGKFAVHVGSKESSTETDLNIGDLTFGHESAEGESFRVTEPSVLHTLATALFSSRGEDRFGLAHQTFAECLGAKYMEGLPLIQVTELLCQRDGAELYVVPQLAETAAWLAGGHEDFLRFILKSEPELLLRSDVARLDDTTKTALVRSVIERVGREEALDFRNFTQFYAGLEHPGLADQLSAVIQDRLSNLLLLRLVLDIAAACRLGSLTTDLLNLLRDPTTDQHLLGYIARSVSELTPPERRGELIPLAKSPNEEIKGPALMALIPGVWKVRDALPFLTFSHKVIGGIYWVAMHFHLPKHLDADDVPDGLRYLKTLGGCFDTLHMFKNTADQIFLKAGKRLDEPAIQDLIVDVWLSQSRSYAPLPIGKDFEFYKQVISDPLRRRALLAAILNSTATTPQDIDYLHLVEPEDLSWLLEQIRDTKAPSRANWAAAVDRVVSPRTAYKVWDEFLSAVATVPELGDRFQSLRAWQLDEEMAIEAKSRFQRWQAFDRDNETAPKPEPEKLLEADAQAAMSGNASRWVRVPFHLYFTDEEQRSSFAGDVTKSSGWRDANEERRTALRLLARRFLLECNDDRPEGAKTNFTHAGYQAAALLRDEIGSDLALRRAVTEKWLPAILDFPDIGEDLNPIMLEMAVSLDRDCCLQKIYNDLWEENTANHMVHSLRAFAHCWDTDVANIARGFAVWEAGPETAANLLHFISKVDEPTALGLFEELVAKAGEPHVDNKFLIFVLSSAIEDLPASIWPIAWRLLNDDLAFAKIVMLHVANHRGFSSGGVAARLSAEQVANLYCLLRTLFPDEEDENRSGTVTPRMAVGYFKHAQIGILATMGTNEACHQLLHMAELFPIDRLYFKSRYRECLAAKRRKLWSPHDPSLILRLIQRAANRIVEDIDDLLDVAIESLNRYQATLTQTPNPQGGALWNYAGAGNRRHDFAPKDEEDLSGSIAAFLQNDLGASAGVILNREVQCQRGQRTDVLVDAIATSEKESQRLTVVIEVKGCWNPDVKTAITTQLVRDYLQPNGLTHGVYLVGWFMCPRWDHRKRKPISHLDSQTFEDAQVETKELAASYDGKIEPYVIRGYLLDCRIWTKDNGPVSSGTGKS